MKKKSSFPRKTPAGGPGSSEQRPVASWNGVPLQVGTASRCKLERRPVASWSGVPSTRKAAPGPATSWGPRGAYRAGRQQRFRVVPPLQAPAMQGGAAAALRPSLARPLASDFGPRVGGARSGILTQDSANPESANPESAKEDIDSGFCELASATANKQ